MQRKFKLIKKFPGSPTLNTIITIESSQETGYYSENKEFWEEIAEIPVGTKVVDTNPETEGYIYEKEKTGLWKLFTSSGFTIFESEIGEDKRFQIVEEVKKDYEILKFYETSPKENRIYNVLEDGNLLWDIPEYKGAKTNPGATHWTEASKKGYLIYQVKRSDGEVFQIGDTVKTKQLSFVINKFSINVHKPSEILLSSLEHTFICNLNEVTKSKPLFTTEDGVDRIKGDEIHFVDCYFKYQGKYIASENTLKLFPNRRIFSTKEAAEEYIILNKPCLSINDVAKVYKTANQFPVDRPNSQGNLLKELVKSKL